MVFEKLHKFIGKGIRALVDRPDDPHCLRLQKNRVYYVREDLMRRATNVSSARVFLPAPAGAVAGQGGAGGAAGGGASTAVPAAAAPSPCPTTTTAASRSRCPADTLLAPPATAPGRARQAGCPGHLPG